MSDTSDDDICQAYEDLEQFLLVFADLQEEMNNSMTDDEAVVTGEAIAHACRAMASRDAPSLVDVLHNAAHDGANREAIFGVVLHSVGILMAKLQAELYGVETMNSALHLRQHYHRVMKILDHHRVQMVTGGRSPRQDQITAASETIH